MALSVTDEDREKRHRCRQGSWGGAESRPKTRKSPAIRREAEADRLSDTALPLPSCACHPEATLFLSSGAGIAQHLQNTHSCFLLMGSEQAVPGLQRVVSRLSLYYLPKGTTAPSPSLSTTAPGCQVHNRHHYLQSSWKLHSFLPAKASSAFGFVFSYLAVECSVHG